MLAVVFSLRAAQDSWERYAYLDSILDEMKFGVFFFIINEKQKQNDF